MAKLLLPLLVAAALCAGCAVPGMPSASAPAPMHGSTKPAYCMGYPDPALCGAQCAADFGQACPIECTDRDPASQAPPACAPAAACEAAKTAAYHSCLGRCGAIPFECR